MIRIVKEQLIDDASLPAVPPSTVKPLELIQTIESSEVIATSYMVFSKRLEDIIESSEVIATSSQASTVTFSDKKALDDDAPITITMGDYPMMCISHAYMGWTSFSHKVLSDITASNGLH